MAKEIFKVEESGKKTYGKKKMVATDETPLIIAPQKENYYNTGKSRIQSTKAL